jgi:hypothetical protein
MRRVARALLVVALAAGDRAGASRLDDPPSRLDAPPAAAFQAAARFGNAVAVSGDTVVVGALLEDVAGEVDAGAAYVFVRSGASWIQQQKLLASDGQSTARPSRRRQP